MVNENWTFISGKYVNAEAEIIRDLLDGYDRRAFPLNHTLSPLDVLVQYYINQIQSLVIHSLNCQFEFFFETQAELANLPICLIFLPHLFNLPNLPNSVKIKIPSNVSNFKITILNSFGNVLNHY